MPCGIIWLDIIVRIWQLFKEFFWLDINVRMCDINVWELHLSNASNCYHLYEKYLNKITISENLKIIMIMITKSE